jgi:general nucleoside transport system permease protein
MAQTADPPKNSGFFYQKYLQVILRNLVMILIAFLLFGIILLLSGKNPVLSFRDIFRSTLGSAYGFSEVIVAMTPMLITALAVAFPARVGLINVGAEGQLYMGALFATWGALTFSGLPAWVLLPGMALLGMLGGGLWAFIPGYLKSIGLVNETITSLLLNSVAPSIVSFFIFGYWHAPRDTSTTSNFVKSARLPTLFGTRIDLSFVLAVVLLVLFWLFMKYTRWGLEMRAIGGNSQSARRNGIPLKIYLVSIMCIGGAIAGLAGMAQVSGYYGLLLANFSIGLGFMGFLISWIAGGEPLGIFLISFVVAVIFTGGNLLQLTQGLPYSVINILLAFTLFIVLARPTFFSKRRRS